jgi:hypothetical protein
LFRRALQTFLSQWIDYKKFHIVEYGIAIQELYDGETIEKDEYTAFLLEKHTQKFAKQPTPLVASITNTRGIIQSLQELFLSLPIQTPYTLLLTDDWEWTNPFLLEEAFWPLSPYSNMVWRSRFEDMMGVYKTFFLRQWVMMAKQGIHPEKQGHIYAYSADEETRVFSSVGSSVIRNMGRSWFQRESYQRVGDSWQKIQHDKRKKINYTILTE